MEIDEIIEQLSMTSCDCHCGYGEEKATVECTQDCKYCKAVKAAIEIMRKYQKVETAMTIDKAIERYSHNAEHERVNGNLQGCLEFRQLAEWLKDYKRLKEQESKVKDVLNKIKSEILQHKIKDSFTFAKFVNIDDVLQIIDKYRQEK